MIYYRFLLALSFILASYMLEGQESYTPQNINIWITGTSTLHDWKVMANDVNGYPPTLSKSSDSEMVIEGFSFLVAVSSMDGGRGASMNQKIYKALQAETHPNVKFTQKTPVAISFSDGNIVEGVLTIAGEERDVSIDVSGAQDNGLITFSGQVPLKLSDFNIEPPSAMFGQIQTKDDITVHFEVSYSKS